MKKEYYLDFLSTLGDVYCETVSPFQPDICPQDGYEVFGMVFGFKSMSITPEKLHRAQTSKQKLAALCDAANKHHEFRKIKIEHIQKILRSTLRRWQG